MDFSIPQDWLSYHDKILDFASALDIDARETDRHSRFSRDAWERCGTKGLLGLGCSAAYGGSFEEVYFAKAAMALRAFGYGCQDNGLGLGINVQVWTVAHVIEVFGSEEQKLKYLPDLCSGKSIGAHAITESASGSDAYGIETTAVKTNSGYVINGAKVLISFAPIADVAIVFAKTAPDAGAWGISAFLVDLTLPGVKRSMGQDKMGMRSVPFGGLTFNQCEIKHDALLGTEGAGMSIINHSLELDRSFIYSSKVGAMRRIVDSCIEYAKRRKVSGTAIKNYQAVSHRIAEMIKQVEVAELMQMRIAWMHDNKKSTVAESAIFKLHVSEAFKDVALEAIRIYGGKGYLVETGIERHLRDAVGGLLYAGTSDIQREIIAKMNGL